MENVGLHLTLLCSTLKKNTGFFAQRAAAFLYVKVVCDQIITHCLHKANAAVSITFIEIPGQGNDCLTCLCFLHNDSVCMF